MSATQWQARFMLLLRSQQSERNYKSGKYFRSKDKNFNHFLFALKETLEKSS